ncbi:hypothetical protein [Methylobacter marinus]|uniref:hypothetical protein n=1 Tax=Methylobacter marinus TaxID=34058 RepID=UPI000369F5FB|nr:hypothetical protein [Methylobacter marinus]
MSKLFEKYSHLISGLSHLSDEDSAIHELLLWENRERQLECFYAPFEHINKSAEIVLIGITPGRTQMNRALVAASHAIRAKSGINNAILEVKRKGSFSGNMRLNIVNTLNKLGYHKKLGIECASELWSTKNHLVNFCSLLKYPIFIKGKDYNGSPNPLKVAELKSLLIEGFSKDLLAIPETAELIPLGDLVADVISQLENMGLVPQKISRFEGKIVAPPHPSGANAESISLLLSDQYPEKEEYLEQMYQDYLRKRSWEKRKSGKPQSESKYKEIRASRWESMLFVRRAYGIDA